MSKRVNPSINAISTLVVLLITAVLVLINVAPKRSGAAGHRKAELRGTPDCYADSRCPCVRAVAVGLCL